MFYAYTDSNSVVSFELSSSGVLNDSDDLAAVVELIPILLLEHLDLLLLLVGVVLIKQIITS